MSRSLAPATAIQRISRFQAATHGGRCGRIDPIEGALDAARDSRRGDLRTRCRDGSRLALLRPAIPGSQPRRTLQRITYDEASLPRDAAWAPDGQWVVYASDRTGNADLWKQRLGDPDPVRLTTSEADESQPQWSPDGQSIVFRSERDGGGLFVIPAGGGAERMSPASATSRSGRRTGRSFSSSVRRSCPICPPSTSSVSMENRHVPSGPTCSPNSGLFMRRGIPTAGASPSGERQARAT